MSESHAPSPRFSKVPRFVSASVTGVSCTERRRLESAQWSKTVKLSSTEGESYT